jgi:hypothetical protein
MALPYLLLKRAAIILYCAPQMEGARGIQYRIQARYMVLILPGYLATIVISRRSRDPREGADNDAGSSFSRDNGQTWIALEDNLSHIVVDAASPTAVWSGAFGPGVYKLTSTILSTRNDVAVQQGLNVYPNPSTDGQFAIKVGTPAPRYAGAGARCNGSAGVQPALAGQR